MRCAIRVDAGEHIGNGHLYRSLALADTLKARGHQSFFISRRHLGSPQNLVTDRGYEQLVIGDGILDSVTRDTLDYREWLGVDAATDAEATRKSIESRGGTDLLITDHYALDCDWETRIECAERIAVIDDLANRKHRCQVLIDQNYYQNLESRYAKLVDENCRLFLGPRYSLLREDFFRLREEFRERVTVNRVLLFFGGHDVHFMTLKLARLLTQDHFENLSIDIVVSPTFAGLEEIENLCTQHSRASLHINTPNMAQLMAEADLFIGSGGTTNWERSMVGLPGLIYSCAENQRPIAEDLASDGKIAYGGPAEEFDEKKAEGLIKNLLSSPETLESYSRASLDMVGVRSDREHFFRALEEMS